MYDSAKRQANNDDHVVIGGADAVNKPTGA